VYLSNPFPESSAIPEATIRAAAPRPQRP